MRSMIRSTRFELVLPPAYEFFRHRRPNGHFRSSPALACLFAELSPPITNTKEVQVNGNGEDTVQKATPDLGTLSEKDRIPC
jgi:hypothetical protein